MRKACVGFLIQFGNECLGTRPIRTHKASYIVSSGRWKLRVRVYMAVDGDYVTRYMYMWLSSSSTMRESDMPGNCLKMVSIILGGSRATTAKKKLSQKVGWPCPPPLLQFQRPCHSLCRPVILSLCRVVVSMPCGHPSASIASIICDWNTFCGIVCSLNANQLSKCICFEVWCFPS